MKLLHFLIAIVAIWLLIAGHSARNPYDLAMITGGAVLVAFLAMTK